MSVPQTFIEKIVKKEGFQFGIFLIGCGDIVEENTLQMELKTENMMLPILNDLNDTPPTPHICDTRIIKIPGELKAK